MTRVAGLVASCLLAAASLAVTTVPPAGRQEGAHWDDSRLGQWVHAVEAHTPGVVDSPLMEMAGMSGPDLLRLWTDVQVLLLVIDDPGRTRFRVLLLDGDGRPEAPRRTSIRVRRDQRTRLGRIAERVRTMSVNRLLKRAAILHTDVAVLAPGIATAAAGPTPAGAPFLMMVGDGVGIGVQNVTLHWELARRLLANVAVAAGDTFVRDWYRATLAIGHYAEQFDTPHREAALRAIPGDAELLFLAGCEHEAFASPMFQAFARSFRRSPVRPGISSAGHELADAERYFRRALAADAGHREARLRLGRVLTLRGRHQDALIELRDVAASDLEPLLAYYAGLFLGDLYQRLGELHEARHWFERAAVSMPHARVPHLPLARVAKELGDREASVSSLTKALTDPPASAAADPWWFYRAAQGRHGQSRLDALRWSLR